MFGAIDSYTAISAIQATKSANDIQIGASNKISGTYTGPIVDDASATAVTQVGFPGTTASPSAVVPNFASNPFSSPPTLGSGALPWPATHNLTHYLPATSAPTTAPGTGWTLYSDTAGNLWAWNGTKSVKLASST